MNIKQLKVSDLKFDPNQTRIHTKRNLDAIRCSLKEHGQVETLLVRAGHNYVISGNGRLEIMRELGWKTVYCNVIELNDKQAKRLSIRMNRSGELAQWDEIELAKQIKEAMDEGEKSDSLGFSKDESDKLATKLQQTLAAMQPPDDFMPEPDVAMEPDVIDESETDELEQFAKPEEDLERQASEAPKKKATPDKNYFYVEFYGDDKTYAEVKTALQNALISDHEIDGQEFVKMAKLYAGLNSRQ